MYYVLLYTHLFRTLLMSILSEQEHLVRYKQMIDEYSITSSVCIVHFNVNKENFKNMNQFSVQMKAGNVQ